MTNYSQMDFAQCYFECWNGLERVTLTQAAGVEQHARHQREQGDGTQNDGGSRPGPVDLLSKLDELNGCAQPTRCCAIGRELQQKKAPAAFVQKQQRRCQTQANHNKAAHPEKMSSHEGGGDDVEADAQGHLKSIQNRQYFAGYWALQPGFLWAVHIDHNTTAHFAFQ